MSSDEASPPFYPLTNDNHAALVVVAAVTFLIYAVVGIGTKLLIRLNIASMKDHDIVLLVSAVFFFVQTICVVAACNHGLGRHQDALSSKEFETASKLVYASNILGMLVNGCAKLSLCLLIRQIDNSGRLNMANMVLGAFILLWTIIGFFTAAFQCPLPSPWLADADHKCPSRGAIYMFNGVMNILTDLALCILPVAMMWAVQTTRKRKAIVMALFETRLIVPILTIPSLSNANYLFHDDSDSTWLAVSSTIWFQISLGLSILTACIPSLKGIIDSLLGSTSVAAIGAPYELRSTRSGKKSGLEVTPIGNGGSKQASHETGSRSRTLKSNATNNKGKSNHTSWSADREISAKYGGRNNSPRGSEVGSESVRKLTEGVIVVRDEFEVQYDDRATSASGERSRESLDGGYRSYA